MGYEQNTNQKSPTRYQLIDKDGNSIGAFINAKAAAEHAKYRWPDQSQDEERSGRGWDVQVCGS